MTDITVAVRPLPHFEGLALPAYETLGAAGMDVRAAVPEDAPIVLEPGTRAMVPTGLSVAIPQGFEIQMRPRSGLAAKHGLTCLNSPGTIDSDYRGELKVILIDKSFVDFRCRWSTRVIHDFGDAELGWGGQSEGGLMGGTGFVAAVDT